MQDKDSIGLVLSGGGAKGAFQAGVWKVMNEFGLADKVRVISGTSAGAINAAAFCNFERFRENLSFLAHVHRRYSNS